MFLSELPAREKNIFAAQLLTFDNEKSHSAVGVSILRCLVALSFILEKVDSQIIFRNRDFLLDQ